jgi:hypothetical protein
MTTQDKPRLFTSLWQRILASTIGVLFVTTLLVAAMPAYLPFGPIDAIGLPIMLFPFFWVGFFLYCFLAKTVWRVWGALALTAALHAYVIYSQLS